MSEFKKPIGKPTYSCQRGSELHGSSKRMKNSTPSTTPMQGKQRTVGDLIEETEKKSSDPFFLEEEEYLEKMAKIIRRDFFPEKLSEEEKLEHETDTSLKELSLNEYIRKYKSEDNETFKKIMDREEERWLQKYWWMFLAEKKDRIKQLALENGDNTEKDMIRRMILPNPNKPLQITNVESHSGMFFMPNYEQAVLDNKPNVDFGSVEAKINYSNTRFDQSVVEEDQVKTARQIVTHMESDIDTRGLSTPFLLGILDPEENTNNAQAKRPFRYNLEELMHGRTKVDHSKEPAIINGYQIHAMPSPAPSQLPSPFITWGQIEDTPIKLNEKIAFKIREVSDREKVANNLASNITKTKAIQKKVNQELLKKVMSSGTPHKVATILSSAHNNSIIKSLLQRKLTGSKITSVSKKTPQQTKLITHSSLTVQPPQHVTSSQNSMTSASDETPLLKF